MPNREILFVGDPHGLLPQIVAEIAPVRPKAVVMLGDYDLERTFHTEVAPLAEAGTEVWWIHGNHDLDHEMFYFRLFETNRLGDRNLDGRVAEVAGVRVAGLGGVFKERVWWPGTGVKPDRAMRWKSRADWLSGNARSARWRGGLPLHLRDAIWWEDYERLWDQRADVLVCHEAPSCHKYGFEVLDELAQAMGVSLIVHGHHHTDYDSEIAGGRIRVMGVGLAGVRAFDGTIIRKGQRGTGRPVLDCVSWESKVEKTK